MSQENVEVVRNAFDAFSRGDIEGVLRLCDEDILITQPQELPGASRQQRGHSGVLEAVRIWPEQWDDYRIYPLRTDSGVAEASEALRRSTELPRYSTLHRCRRIRGKALRGLGDICG